jgi:uncharacterized membrane protein YdjX (TVP38/TMEM64 family)
MFRLLWPPGLLVLSALDAAGLPVPAEAALVARSTTGGATAVALLAAWIGFTLGDVAAFELWRHGWRRAPELWQTKATRLHFHELGPFSVALTRLLPISSILNIAFARSSMSSAEFALAAGVGDLAYALAVLLLGAGAFAIIRASPAGAIGAAALVAVVVGYEWRRHRRRSTSVDGGPP